MAQYPPFTTSGLVNAAGALTLEFRPRGNDLVRATQVTGEMALGSGSICSLRRNGALISALVPTGGAAGGDPPVWLWPGDVLTVEWSGAPVGATGKMVVIYDLGP